MLQMIFKLQQIKSVDHVSKEFIKNRVNYLSRLVVFFGAVQTRRRFSAAAQPSQSP